MTKRRISRASKRRLTLFGTVSLIAVVYFVFSLVYNAYTIYDLTSKKNELEALQDKADQLKIDIEKLNDPNYLANYARENYLYSKDGEYIIQMDDDEYKNAIDTLDTIDALSIKINKNYIILGLSFLMLLIFIYILSKGRKKSKKRKK